MRKMFEGLAGLLLVSLTWAPDAAQAQNTLANVRQRGYVICGAHPASAGFSMPDSRGEFQGFDIDHCRALAAAVLGDPKAVRFRPLSSQQRLAALQSGEIDVLIRTTTWTMSRDTASGLSATNTTFYDGQGFIVRKSLGVRSARELAGATVCVSTGTTNELNLADWSRVNGVKVQQVVIEQNAETNKAYEAGRCDALTTDASALAGMRTTFTNPDDHIILPDIISKEPLSPYVRQGDEQWFHIVRWVTFALVEAEESGVTAKNVDAMLQSNDPNIRRLLGVTPGLGKPLGLDERWAYNAIKAVGNYGEIFDRNVGKDSPLKLDRGLNALWIKGGMMYAPPVR
jgi:general L-amino acid transport system substrate-binding protein